jgi:hypothetical protein
MEKNMKNIDDFFKEELGSYAELPPPPAWGALERRLDEEKKRRAFPYGWLWVVSVIALVAITGLSAAWKMSASRELLAARALQTQHPTATNTPGNITTAIVPGNKQETKTIAHRAKTSKPHQSLNTGKHAITTTSKNIWSTDHMVLASAKHTTAKHRNKLGQVTVRDNTQPTEGTVTKTDKSSTSAPSDEDYYEGATASIAPMPTEQSAPTGYTVNKRKKHNMLVADMSPKEEPVVNNRPEQPVYAAVPAENNDATIAAPATTKAKRSIAHHTDKHAIAASRSAQHRRQESKLYAVAEKQNEQPKTETGNAVTTTTAHRKVALSATDKHIAVTKKAKKPEPAAATAILAANTHQTLAKSSKSEKAVAATPATATIAKEAIAVKATNTAATQLPSAGTETVQKTATVAVIAKQAKQLAAKTNATNTAIAKQTSATTMISAPQVATKNNQSKQDVRAGEKQPIERTVAATAQISATPKQSVPVKAMQSAIAGAPATRNEKATSGTDNATKADKQPDALALNASAPKAKHSKKSVAKDNDIATTAVAAISGTQSTKKPTKKQALKTAAIVASMPVPANEATSPSAETAKAMATTAKATKPVTAKGLPKENKTAGKQVTSFAAKATPAKAPVAAKTSKQAKTYTSKMARMTEEEMPTEDPTTKTAESTTLAAGKQDEPAATAPSGTFKEKALAASNPIITEKEEAKPATDSTATAAANRRRFEMGIKAGFEGSYSDIAARKMIISPYLEYKINNKFSLLTQPAIKGSNLQKRNLNGTQTLYNISHSDSTMTSAYPTLITTTGGIVDTLAIVRTYNYTQTHDSLVKSYSVGGTYFEFEIPLLLKYAITPKLSAYAGININYCRAIRVNEQTFNSGPITLDSIIATVTPKGQPMAEPQSVSSLFTYSGQPLSGYSGPLYPNTSGGMLRLGYMLGFSYEFKNRWLLDALVQQSFAKSNTVGGMDVNKPLTMPYMRLTLGYRLTK